MFRCISCRNRLIRTLNIKLFKIVASAVKVKVGLGSSESCPQNVIRARTLVNGFIRLERKSLLVIALV